MTEHNEIEMINIKNALNIANQWLSEVQYDAPYFGSGDMEAIKYALEKQTPMKPHYEADGYSDGELVYDIWRCPNCDEGYEVDDEYDFCPNCGQRLDWSTEES